MGLMLPLSSVIRNGRRLGANCFYLSQYGNLTVILPRRRFSSSSSYGRRAVRVRFAPSPTGEMHLGGLRTALYNFVFARKSDGQFIVRIEDTDQTRLVDGSQDRLLETLIWAGLRPDEGPEPIGGPKGPYLQSQRLPFYQEFVQKLLDNGSAYRCFCTERRLDLLRQDAQRRRQSPRYDGRCKHLTAEEINQLIAKQTPYVVRFKLKEGPMTFDDVVYGPITLDISLTEGDFILMKSDGFPTYHLANVVDDHLMDISHVLRGVEWQMSTPKHLQIFEALGLLPPTYAHLPHLTDQDGRKLSKRNKAFMCDNLKGKYLSQAVINFLFMSGGGIGRTDGEFFHMSDLIKKFELTDLNTSSCKLNLPRLDEMNQLAIRALGTAVEKEALALVRTRYPDVDADYFSQAFHANKVRLKVLSDLLSPQLEFLWKDLPKEHLVPDAWRDAFVQLSGLLERSTFEHAQVLNILKTFHKECMKDIDFKDFMRTLRILLSGLHEGPGVAEMMVVLGKERTLSRLSRGM